MNHVANIDRRSFVASAAALGGGFALGFEIPFGGPSIARAQDGAPEINAWVVIRPDDTVAIRIARAEMGQGTLTGLAQLVAEELECDWSKVTADHPTPGQNVARKRVWGDFSTTGSRGIRESNEYVRKGGAAARMMLVQAAANAWKVPAAECTAENGVITHKPSGRTTSYGNVAEAAAKLEPPTDVTLKDPKDWKIAGKPLKRLDAEQAFVGNQKGDVKSAIAGAAKKVEAIYGYPYQAHACMEPLNATALYTADKCEVWTGSQNAEAALAATSEASGLPVAKCDVHKFLLGGGFGRRGRTDYVTQAVLIAKQVPGTPVKLLWSREEDMTQDTYHPITQCRLTGAFDANGNLTGLHMRISGQSILATLAPARLQNGRDPATSHGLNPGGTEGVFGYDIPHLLIDHAMRNPHVTPGFWRGVNNNQNAIYLECFMDELAHAAGQDPLEFRRKLMTKHPKHLAVLNAVAEKIGWGQPAAQGVYRGLAQQMGYGSYVAAAAEISVTGGNKIKIHRIVGATDCGHAVNPAQIERQVSGSFVYGLSALFNGECTVKDGRIEQTNFDTYNSMRIAEMPKVESIVMPSGGFWGGVGEPTIFVAAPAVLNAFFAATGKRIRSIPLKNHNISFA